jgi:lipoyl(octanoyl) transferase
VNDDKTMRVIDLGLQPYEIVWQDMQRYTDARDADSEDQLWLVEHPPVFTLGKNGKPEHVLAAGDIPLVRSDRGGQVTYHGPGQLVVYVLLDIQRMQLGVRELVTRLERSVIELLADYGIAAESKRDAPGVYVDGAKIAALGLRVRKGRCFHGLALNVDMDLEPFSRIDPCGYPGLQVTQLLNLVKSGGENVTLAAIKPQLVSKLQQQLSS